MQNRYLSWFAMLFCIVALGGIVYTASLPMLIPPSLNIFNRNTNTIGSPQTGTTQNILASSSKIKKFSTQEELANFLAEHRGSSSSMYLKRGVAELAGPTAAPSMPGSPSVDFPQDFAGFSESTGGGSDYSTTNIQVQGVDEADIVKTDGKYIYAVSQNNLFIVDAYPAADSKILAKIEFKSQPQNIYIADNRLVVYGYDNQIYQTKIYTSIRPQSGFIFFKVFDISDPKNPKQIKNLDFEGSYLNSRMIGDYVYLLTSKYAYGAIDDPRPLPIIIEDGERVMNDSKAPGYVFPNVYYFDIVYDGYSLTNVHAINVKDVAQKILSETYVVDPNQQIFVSPDALYLTYTKRVSEEMLAFEVTKSILLPKLSDRDQKRIAEIEAVPNYILSPNERFSKIAVIIEGYVTSLSQEDQQALQTQLAEKVKEKYDQIQKELEKTVIHKIGLDKNTLTYKGFGEVPGYVLNQYSMDEHDGFFRIATTKSRSWSQFADEDQTKSYNNLFVLDSGMKVVGSVENLAAGEQIYSVRFMGKRAYMVTFRQTDPFFAIDLSDPRNPRVLGELKIPGFSNYLHPYDDTTIIGLGKDTEENQYGGVVQKGVKISLFDVADIANPKEVAKYVVSDPSSYSIALTDPKAFLFNKEKNLLVIPLSTYANQVQPLTIAPGDSRIYYPKNYFTGAYVFTITKNHITLKGTIRHTANPYSGQDFYSYGGYNYGQVKRSLYINEVLYTLSDGELKMNKLDDLADIKDLILKKEASGDDDFIIVN